MFIELPLITETTDREGNSWGGKKEPDPVSLLLSPGSAWEPGAGPGEARTGQLTPVGTRFPAGSSQAEST